MATETLSPLEALIEPLEEFEYISEHQPANEENIYEKLYVGLDVEDPNPDRVYGLEIFFVNDVTEAFGDEEEEEDAIITQFMLILPFRVPMEAYLSVMRYCNIVNRMLPVGAFGVSEPDGAIYLRHCLASESRAIPQVVLLEIVTAMEFACQSYGPQFEALVTGEKTFEDYIREFQESGRQLPSVGNPDVFSGAEA